jgi:hypothetical protein
MATMLNVGRTVAYAVKRFTIATGAPSAEFRSRYEAAVPPLPRTEVANLVQRQAPWQEMLDLVARAAPWGFLLNGINDVSSVVSLAGGQASAVSYLMGNHAIMERMFRYEPAVLLYAPLHTVIWSQPGGEALFAVDKPSDQFGSFGNPDVTTVGLELDQKLVGLLEHLDVAVPTQLLES